MIFLLKGFEELNIKPDHSILWKVIENFDEIIEWLTYFGVACTDKELSMKPLKKSLRQHPNFLYKKLNGFLKTRENSKNRYINILKRLPQDLATWPELKEWLNSRKIKNK